MSKAENTGDENKLISPNTEITLSLQQLITYSIFLITVGASIYTLVKTLPKIDRISEDLTALKDSETKISNDIEWLKKLTEEKRNQNN